VALGNASGIGAFFGVLANGYLTDIFGKKKLMLYSLVVLSAFITMTFKADSIVILLIGEMLCGLPWGVLATIAPACQLLCSKTKKPYSNILQMHLKCCLYHYEST